MKKKLVAMSALPLVMYMSFFNQAIAEDALPASAVQPASNLPVQTESQAEDEKARLLKEMVVTADRERPVQQRTELGMLTKETPLAGTVVDRKELEQVRSVSTLNEIMRRVPGVSMSRNMRFADGGKNYTDNRTDGMRTRNTGTYGFVDQSNTGDIERIEFIRGPGSVLNSSNAIGGTINVITRNPPNTSENEATYELMGDGGYRAGVTSAGPISNKLGYFVNANRQDTQGWRVHTAEKKDSFSTKWVVFPEDVAKLSFRLEYLHDDYQDSGSLTQEEFDQDWRQAAPNTYYRTDVEYTTPSLQYRRLFGDNGELNVYAQSRKTDSTAKTPSYGGGATGKLSDNTATENNIQLLYKHSFELAKSAITGGIDNMTTDSQTKSYADISTDFDFVRGALTGDSITMERHRSPFLQYEFSPLQPLRFAIGARNDNIKYTIDDQITDTKDGSKTWNRTTKKAGVTYELNASTILWADIGEGFLAPSISTLLGSNTPPPATKPTGRNTYVPTNMDLLPETSLTKQIGIRGQTDFGLSFDTDYYQTRFKNLIVSQTCSATEVCTTRNENAASAHASGVETTMGYKVNHALSLAMAHTYSLYAYDNYVTSAVDYSGLSRNYTPKHHVNLRVAVKPVEKLKVELEGDYTSSYYSSSNNQYTYARPDLYNLRASYGGKEWEAWFHVLNLLNTKYADRQSTTDAGVSTYSSGYTARIMRAGVAYNF
ncbi:MAG: TonB-dependent receptor [Gammaproteobacteria bacterium]|nr:TonB-dependent receptor [Gammaproteobacteria bacterium]MBU1777122.1 TonB-dependent receptor [Gammaproteobacteria bacterium]MBU1967804.1 TonB-dependent receptor [Gammaproteobacteria bacterium]